MKHERKDYGGVMKLWLNKLTLRMSFLLLALFACTVISAQTSKITVSGTIADNLGEPLIGASIVEKGTTNGSMTDTDGRYSITVPAASTLEVSYLGFTTISVPVNGKETLNITLAEDDRMLKEVVVTALGIKREKKALGYAMQELSGDILLEARETNIANALSGKISGVQVVRSSGGAGGSSRIQLRGNTSVTGLNQPLIVVDGVPMDNFVGAEGNDFDNPTPDYGSGIGDIAAEDIESMSVLKGASAAALYGARAGNGVILITTKTGIKRPGLGITVSASVSAETRFLKPDLQNNYGQGIDGVYESTSGNSWGPRIEGQEYTKWNGEKDNMKSYNNLDNYVNIGTNLTENISFSQQYGNVSVYTSINRMDEVSQVPGSKLKRTNLTARALSKLGEAKRWTLDVKMQYINANAENRPLGGRNNSNVFRTMSVFPRSLDIRDFKDHTDDNGKMVWFGGADNKQINPYWSRYKRYNQDVRERFIMHASLKYEFTDWLNAELKAGSDMYNTDYTTKVHSGSPDSPEGSGGYYAIGKDKFFENNYNFLIVANKDNLIDKFGGAITFGGNLMMQRRRKQTASTQLLIENLFTITNSFGKIDNKEEDIEREMNSLYGLLQLNYGGWIFLDATFRNDWTSTLSKENRSFFYPSVSTSWVISDWLDTTGTPMPAWVDLAKLRASYAQVGNDMDPYQLYNTYKVETDPNDNVVVGPNETLYDSNVRSELIKSWEVGAEVRFFGNRLGLDFAWYKDNSTRQLLDIALDPMSGYKQMKVNAGNIQNTGIEIMLNARPLQLENGFNWDIMVNFSKNKNTVKYFTDEVTEYTLTPHPFDKVKFIARAGGNYGEIWGTSFSRVTDKDSPHYGRMIVGSNGIPQENTEMKKLGDQEAKALLGITNTFTYKGWGLSFLIDARLGGQIFSGSNYTMQLYGTAEATAPGGNRDDFIVNAVVADGSGGYKENDVMITQQQYWRDGVGSGNMGIAEANIYSATNVRLRNLSLSYDFNRTILKKTPFQKVKLGFTANNLWMINSHLNGIDPESVYSTGTNATGYENGSAPTTRSYMFNVTLGF